MSLSKVFFYGSEGRRHFSSVYFTRIGKLGVLAIIISITHGDVARALAPGPHLSGKVLGVGEGKGRMSCYAQQESIRQRMPSLRTQELFSLNLKTVVFLQSYVFMYFKS